MVQWALEQKSVYKQENSKHLQGRCTSHHPMTDWSNFSRDSCQYITNDYWRRQCSAHFEPQQQLGLLNSNPSPLRINSEGISRSPTPPPRWEAGQHASSVNWPPASLVPWNESDQTCEHSFHDLQRGLDRRGPSTEDSLNVFKSDVDDRIIQYPHCEQHALSLIQRAEKIQAQKRSGLAAMNGPGQEECSNLIAKLRDAEYKTLFDTSSNAPSCWPAIEKLIREKYRREKRKQATKKGQKVSHRRLPSAPVTTTLSIPRTIANNDYIPYTHLQPQNQTHTRRTGYNPDRKWIEFDPSIPASGG